MLGGRPKIEGAAATPAATSTPVSQPVSPSQPAAPKADTSQAEVDDLPF